MNVCVAIALPLFLAFGLAWHGRSPRDRDL
jgi:hypothetical protein